MEGMYSKLLDKYTKLKSQKETEIESVNFDQEVKFMDYKAAADELIQHLRSENVRLRSYVIDLKNEMAPIRFSGADRHDEPLGNQNETNDRVQDTAGKDKTDNIKSVISGNKGIETDTTNISTYSSKRKRRRGSTPVESDEIHILRSNSVRKSSKHHGTAEEVVPENDSTTDDLPKNALVVAGSHCDQPACCRQTQDLSANCVFQDLIEHLLGMKLTTAIQADRRCISAFHQSSGYSFKLTLVEKIDGGEIEVIYDPISLGTFEMGAPEWMKEMIIFSMLMSPVFFERVLRVIK